MDRSPPPFFRQGPSANARFAAFALAALTLLVIDARVRTLEPIRYAVGSALHPLQRALLAPRELFAAGREYLWDVERLRRENSELRKVQTLNARSLIQVEFLEQENRQLRDLLEARRRPLPESQVAEILFETRDNFSDRPVLDRGLQEGLRLGQPVIDTHGLVGQITRVFARHAEMTRISDPEMAVPVQVVRTGQRAIAFGTPEAAGRGRLELRHLPAAVDLRVGDQLVTSGLDGVFPAGLAVGEIDRLEPGRLKELLRAGVLLHPRPTDARMVLVLTGVSTGMPEVQAPATATAARSHRRAH